MHNYTPSTNTESSGKSNNFFGWLLFRWCLNLFLAEKLFSLACFKPQLFSHHAFTLCPFRELPESCRERFPPQKNENEIRKSFSFCLYYAHPCLSSSVLLHLSSQVNPLAGAEFCLVGPSQRILKWPKVNKNVEKSREKDRTRKHPPLPNLASSKKIVVVRPRRLLRFVPFLTFFVFVQDFLKKAFRKLTPKWK